MKLVETLRNEIGENAISSLSQKLDIREEDVRTGIDYTIPTILGGLLKKGAGSGTLGSLSSIFTGNTIAVTTDPEQELVDSPTLLERGKSMLSDLFGGDVSTLVTGLQEKSGLPTEKASALLTMAVPLITSYIGRFIAKQGWSMPDFIGHLFENKASIESALPMGIASTVGIEELNVPNLNPPEIEVDTPASPIPEVAPMEENIPPTPLAAEPSSSGNVLKWIIIIALVVLVVWWFFLR